MTMATFDETHAPYPVLDAASQELMFLDTGQLLEAATAADNIADDDNVLKVTFLQIHREDPTDAGDWEPIMSTLKYFSLEIAVQNATGDLQFDLDGTILVATLIYDDGKPVTDVSATLEPPLLGAAGECPPKAVIEGGVATFRLRITVLSSLCNKHNFAVLVTSKEAPEMRVATAPVKTITKLRRGVRGGGDNTRDALDEGALATEKRLKRSPLAAADNHLGMATTCGAKRALCVLGDEVECQASNKCEDEATLNRCLGDALSGSDNLDDLWDQVAQNGARLLELQAQQRKLFKELRALKEGTVA